MRIRRLGWAGIEIEAAGGTAVVDLLENGSTLAPFTGEPRTPLPPARKGAALALVTHLHEDHTDAAALARVLAPGGVVLRPQPAGGEPLEVAATVSAERALAEAGLRTQVVAPWETVHAGPFEATAIPAADGFGDPQVSWALVAEDRRVIHCGDTLFHGWWWLAKLRCGPFDAAFLPVNGPSVDLPHRQPPSRLPAAMDARQAAEAAALLEAAVAVPIHYDTFDNPPVYAQGADPAAAVAAAARERGAEARIVVPGEEVALPVAVRA